MDYQACSLRRSQSATSVAEPFLRAIRTDLEQAYDLTLTGSWHSNEYHLKAAPNGVISFSDLDFVYPDTFLPEMQIAAHKTVLSVASVCGLKLRDVSFRPASEMANMWRMGAGCRPQDSKSSFLLFWSLVGVADAILAIAKDGTWSEDFARYRANKWLLLLWWDMALAHGVRTAGYRAAAKFAAQRLSSPIAEASYRMKLGEGLHADWQNSKRLGAAAISVLTEMLGPKDIGLMRELAELDWIYGSDTHYASRCLQEAVQHEADISERTIARLRLYRRIAS